MNPRLKMHLLFASYVFLVVLVSLLPGGGFEFWHVDKIGHFLAYTGMSVLVFLTFSSKTGRLVALVFAAVLGAVLEWGQSFVPGRDMSLIDGIANTLGVLSGVLLFRLRGHVLVDRLETSEVSENLRGLE